MAGGVCVAGGVCGGGTCVAGGHAWQGACMVGEGSAWWGACMADTTRYSDTVNERAIRILLECILVTRYNQGGSKG